VTVRRGYMLLATEVALAVVTFTAITGMHRLFVDGSYRGPLAVQAVVAHLVVAMLRRRRVPLVPAAGITVVAAVLVLSWTRFPDTVRYLLPTGGTLSAAGDDLEAAWRLFQEVKAPAPVENGFIVATGVAIWLLAYIADWAAFRAGAAFEALLPATTLFLFAAALDAPGDRVASAAVFAAAALLFVLLHRTISQEQSSTWAASHRAHGRWSLLGTGAALTGIAVTAGALAGPRLPGAEADPVLAWRDVTDDEPTRVVVSPMVDLRTRIVEQPNVEVFTVRSPQPSYWRLTALDEFDGTIWRSSYGTDDADGELPAAVESGVDTEQVTQAVTISALNSVWLPAAYEPVALDPGDNAVGWDADSSTLIVDREVPTSDGFTYEVTSALPLWTDDELRSAPTAVPDEIADGYLGLPDDLSSDVLSLADQVTARAETQFDKALALQNLLLGFTYDQTVPAGHSSDALRAFLFDTQRGYCEQFAGSFAAMGRAVGLPTRVAVGFSWGIQDPNDQDLYRVRGIHAHAWPEVYFDGYGWVPFEPTPGRAPPRAGEWLGLQPQQASAEGAAATLPGGVAGADQPGDGLATGEAQRPAEDPLAEFEAAQRGDDAGGSDELVPREIRNAALALAAGVAAYLVLVPLAMIAVRLVRRRRATTPADKVRLAWREANRRAADAGIELPPSLTIAEAADRLAAALPRAAAAVHGTARTMEKVAYAELPPSDDEVTEAHHAWAVVNAEVNGREPRWSRLLRYFDVRRLLPHERRQRLVTQHRAAALTAR
jgi:transglutaminase-like putative cysteine protease